MTSSFPAVTNFGGFEVRILSIKLKQT